LQDSVNLSAGIQRIFDHAGWSVRNGCRINQLHYDLICTNCGDGMTLNQTRYLVFNSGLGNFVALREISPDGLPRARQFSIPFTF
jgi:hypothetical protein